MPKAVIFDLDGLLVDSQPLQYKSYKEAFKKFGYNLTLKDWGMWIHNSLNTQKLVESKKLNINISEVRKEKRRIFENLVLNELKLKPGVRSLVNKLHKKFPLAIASSSRIESINLIIRHFNLADKFKVALSDTKLKHGKPFPDIYLKTAREIGVKPHKCVVLEDSVVGLTAAKAAGMKCIVCPDSFCPVPITKFKKADKIVKSLKEVTVKMLEQMFIEAR